MTQPLTIVHARARHVLGGVMLFLTFQYGMALWKLGRSSGSMANKFSALARDEYMGFLVVQNLRMLLAYAMLAIAATILIQPAVHIWTGRSKFKGRGWVAGRALGIMAVIHSYCTLRLADSRPYFLNEAAFGQGFYKALDWIPAAIKGPTHVALFTVLPAALLLAALIWQLRRLRRRGWITLAALTGITTAATLLLRNPTTTAQPSSQTSPNIIIIGSDSLRGDRLGCAGYRPSRTDGSASQGVSPVIDALAARSTRFENCYTAIASTMESGTQLMTSMYPQTHGIRQMYPDRKTVEATRAKITPLAPLLQKSGYDTAAIGDWCAGYYEVVPLGLAETSVSTFDNFKIYMSQAVVMAHFIVPLYFDNPLGYRVFPELGAFAQFVTPEVVTQRVEKRLATAARSGRPFFWHVFYSCNHLPYRSREPYRSMFADPSYQGRNRNGVDFDIDSFIGGTDLESKWKALPPKEVQQIRALYDGCTRQFDDCVGRILSAVEANGLAKNTIIIVTSDHGDDHYEPGVTLGHGLTFNGGLQANHVPMIVHVPGTSPQVIKEAVRLIDVAPTIARFAGVSPPAIWQGKEFASWILREQKPEFRPFYGETGFPFIQFSVPGVVRPKLPPMDEMTFIDKSFNYQFVLKEKYLQPLIHAKQRCLRTRDWKIVCTPTDSGHRHFGLFHMTSDPHGEQDLASSRREVLEPMRHALERWMDEQYESPIAEIFPEGEPQ